MEDKYSMQGAMEDFLSQNPDNEDLFVVESDMDVNTKYMREESIGVTDYTETRDIFSMFSAELEAPENQIRSDEQQAEWTKKKSECQKLLAKYLLRMDSVVEALIEHCDGKLEHLLGVIKQSKEGARVYYDVKLHAVVKGMLERYLAGDRTLSIAQISDTIVDDYNLSYCHFIQSQAARVEKEYNEVSKWVQEHGLPELMPEQLAAGENIELFSPPEDNPVTAYEAREGCTYRDLTGINRNRRLLCHQINQFRNLLVTTNLRGCLSKVFKIWRGRNDAAISELDLISEGSIGLMRAADMYVYGVCSKFNTYADYWINLRITRHIKNNNPVRIPIYVSEKVGRIVKHLRDINKSGEMALPAKVEVEAFLKEPIHKNTWQLAINRFHNMPININCVTTENDDDSINFDGFSEVMSDENENLTTAAAHRIMTVLDAMVEKKEITTQHREIFLMKYLQERTFEDIAEHVGGRKAKAIRADAAMVVKKIQIRLGVYKLHENGGEA
jgi:RNA polymerase sigma factor (sigma-70 family)